MWLRITVVVQCWLCVVAAMALVLELTHPLALAALRNSSATPSAPAASPRRQIDRQATENSPSMRLISMTTSAATYLVPTSRFSITIIVAHPCWIAIRSPWNAATPSFTSTLVPSAVRGPIDIETSASVVLAAQAIAIWITEGSTVLGSVDDPVVGLSYVFESDS